MSNSSLCPTPFLDETPFLKSKLGCKSSIIKNGSTLTILDVSGRFCGSIGGGNLSCCFPCPLYPYIFSDSFLDTSKRLQYASPFSLATCTFLLLSWLCLPADKSHRHYLSVGLIVSVLLIAVSEPNMLSSCGRISKARTCYTSIPTDTSLCRCYHTCRSTI
jgi:hypothetical protein